MNLLQLSSNSKDTTLVLRLANVSCTLRVVGEMTVPPQR